MTGDLSKSILDPKSFEAIANLAYRESGLQLVPEKSTMIQTRLRNRLRSLGIEDFQKYASLVCSEDGVDERRWMISALTTNVSHFFREKHHFETLVQSLMPQVIDGLRNGEKVRIWSAGCSNGQEAYSIAMALMECYPELINLDFKILATDIDLKVVTFGRQANYPDQLVSGVPDDLLKKYFNKEMSDGETTYTVCSELKAMIVFKELNMLASWPMKQTMDAIFCRNVVIYFDSKTQNSLWPRFRQQLGDHGYLFLGHSERIMSPEFLGFANCGATTYRPIAALKTQSERKS